MLQIVNCHKRWDIYASRYYKKGKAVLTIRRLSFFTVTTIGKKPFFWGVITYCSLMFVKCKQQLGMK